VIGGQGLVNVFGIEAAFGNGLGPGFQASLDGLDVGGDFLLTGSVYSIFGGTQAQDR